MLNSSPTITDEEIQSLINFLNDKVSYENPRRYVICEWFANEDKVSDPVYYDLYNIKMELENNTIITTDAEEILWEEHHAIQSFLISDIIYIAYQDNDNMITIVLGNEEYDGYIKICY
jgi:hypothetical protein